MENCVDGIFTFHGAKIGNGSGENGVEETLTVSFIYTCRDKAVFGFFISIPETGGRTVCGLLQAGSGAHPVRNVFPGKHRNSRCQGKSFAGEGHVVGPLDSLETDSVGFYEFVAEKLVPCPVLKRIKQML